MFDVILKNSINSKSNEHWLTAVICWYFIRFWKYKSQKYVRKIFKLFVELENLIKWYSRSHNGDVDDTNIFFLFFLEWRSLFLLLKLNQTRSSAVHKLILFDLIFLPTPSIATSTSAAATTAAAAATAAPTLITERSYWCSRLSETCS